MCYKRYTRCNLRRLLPLVYLRCVQWTLSRCSKNGFRPRICATSAGWPRSVSSGSVEINTLAVSCSHSKLPLKLLVTYMYTYIQRANVFSIKTLGFTFNLHNFIYWERLSRTLRKSYGKLLVLVTVYFTRHNIQMVETVFWLFKLKKLFFNHETY